MGEIKSEINDPQKNMPAERFKKPTKFTLIIANKDYNKAITTMESLPAVQNDLEKARITAKLMGVPPENTIELINATHDELEHQYKILTDRIKSLSRKLDGGTGILGFFGFEWDKMKKSAMKLEGNFNSIEVEFE